MNYASAPFSVKTVNQLKQAVDNGIYLAERDFKELVEFQRDLEVLTGPPSKSRANVSVSDFAVNDLGQARVVNITWNAAKTSSESEQTILTEPGFSLNYDSGDGKKLAQVKISIPVDLKNNYNLSSFLALNDSELMLIMTPFDLKKSFDFVVILHLQKTKGRWIQRFYKFSISGISDAVEFGSGWSVTPSGRLILMRRQKLPKMNTVKLSFYEINRETFAAKLTKPEFEVDLNPEPAPDSAILPLSRGFDWEDGAFINDSGRILVGGTERNLQTQLDGRLFEITNNARLVLGNFTGFKDGDDPRNVSISKIRAGRFVSENRFVFIDKRAERAFLRELTFR
jgi:hypothetical protein